MSINMSPLWGFDVFGYPHCYKHAAPLGLWVVVDPACYTHAAPLGLWLLGHAARL